MTNKSTRRRNAVISAIAGAALLVGGSTYALWSSNATIRGGEISSGDLAIVAGDMQAWDVSQDRKDTEPVTVGEVNLTVGEGEDAGPIMGHIINQLESPGPDSPNPDAYWKMVPGDRVAMVVPYTITLKGDNLVAGLTIEGDFSQAIRANGPVVVGDNPTNPIALSYQLFNNDGSARGDEIPVTAAMANGIFVSYFQDSSVGQLAGKPEANDQGEIIQVDDNGTAVITFVLYVDFNSKVIERNNVNSTLVALGENLTATLQQIRCEITVDSNFKACPQQ